MFSLPSLPSYVNVGRLLGWAPGWRLRSLLLAFAVTGVIAAPVQAQIDGPLIYLQRGQLWNSYYYGKTASPFNNWRRIDYGMDWPGFRPEMIGAEVGGGASHLLTGGFWFSAKDSRGKVITRDDFAMYASSTTPESGAKYKVTRHERAYKNGANYWLQANPQEAEDVIVSEWEANPDWLKQYEEDRQHPIRVRREVRQWGGYEKDQNYILLDYTITNISDSTIYDAYAMIAYAFVANERSWQILFPSFTSGARNSRFIFNPAERLLFGWAIDYPETPGRDETYGWYPEGGPEERGEYLAPAYVGLKILNVSPNKQGRADHIASYAWVPADNQQDQYGPFLNQTGFEEQYDVIRDPTNALNAIRSPADPAWGTSRMWSLVSLGPWDLAPGDSIEFAWAEVIGGIDYARAITPATQASVVGQTGFQQLAENARRAQFAHDHGHNLPDPPPPPPFEVRLHDVPGVIGNVIDWTDAFDRARDPDYEGAEAEDLAGYRLYRSYYLPIGPWELVAEVEKEDPTYFDAATGTYTVVDTTVTQGFSYYYALTAYDTGHASWPVDPAYRFPETRSNTVPSLESSLFANRSEQPFKATIPAASTLDNILVVPNPFIAQSGFVNPRDGDVIQFINVPSPSTLRIYTMGGTLVKTIDHDDGSGIAFWDQVTDFGQFVESGVYLFHVEAQDGTTTGKFAIVR